MKKIIMMMMAAVLFCGCEKLIITDGENEDENGTITVAKGLNKKFTFTVKGDFGSATFENGDDISADGAGKRAAGYLSADGQDMTDLWVFDYVGGECVQTVHQTATDEAWGKPTLTLAYGSHHVYFVASRGDNHALDAEGHVITWGIPRDTFWKDYQVDVVSTSNGNRAVTLDRVVTKLRLTINDEIPAGCAQVCVTPERWYYGWDYVGGVAVAQQQTERVVNVPATYVGTVGVSVNIFGLSGSSEWVTNVSIQAKDGGGAVIGSANITGAPFKANRSTEYSGNLFASGGAMNVGLGADWEVAHTGTW